jgi:alginate O-acetyltransferase complex protein AlgI
MIIAGIWHGAAWGFIVWGAIHGIALVVHRLTETLSKKCSIQWLWETLPGIIFSWLITQTMVFSAWIFFRLPNLKDSIWVVQHLWGKIADVQFAHKVYIEALGLERINIIFLLASLFVVMGIATGLHRGLNLQIKWPIKLLFVPLCFFLVFLLAPKGGLPYIYFEF